MRIIQLSDCHLMVDPCAELKGIRTRERFEQVWAAVQSRHAEAERLVVTGDLTHDEQLATYETLRESLRPWYARLRMVPGNHDDRALMRQVFVERIQLVDGRNVFCEEVSGWKLIGLDSHVPGELSGRIGDDQLHWLAGHLADKRQLPTCLFVHHPPITMHSAWLDRIGLQDSAELLALVRGHLYVRAVCSGHVHQERTVVLGQAALLTTPSTGVQFRPETEALEVDSAAPGYRVLDLSRDGSVTTWVERVEITV